MLVLSRKSGESILLHLDPSTEHRTIRLTQVRVGTTTSRLGIDAPAGVVILREEIVCESDGATVAPPSAEVTG